MYHEMTYKGTTTFHLPSGVVTTVVSGVVEGVVVVDVVVEVDGSVIVNSSILKLLWKLIFHTFYSIDLLTIFHNFN